MKDNIICIRKKRLTDYKALIFDLDGTLYYQKPFRLKMIRFLAGKVIAHPSCIRDMFVIKKYREIRENWELYDNDDIGSGISRNLDMAKRQYAYVAKAKGVSPERVREIIEYYMLEAPLALLPPYRDETLAGIIEEIKSDSPQTKIVIYSDYPVEDKLRALGINADEIFTSGDEEIGCMKPAPRGLDVIAGKLGIDKSDAVMIGDRYEKDGLAAISNGMDYIIVSTSKSKRQELFKGFTQNKYDNYGRDKDDKV